MYKIKVKEWLGDDFEQLRKEYNDEDKSKYKRLYNQYIPSYIRKSLKEGGTYHFLSKEYYPEGFVWGVNIFVNRYNQVTPSFYAPFDLQEFAVRLREEAGFRDFTKLCFYIVEIVNPKT